MFSIKEKCSKCGFVFYVSSEDAKVKHFISKDGQSIYAIYYDCPSCCNRHFVQLDNDITKALADKQIKLFVKMSRARKAGRQVHKKQSAKYSKINKDLTLFRKRLNLKYNGTEVTDAATGESVVICLQA